MAYALSNKVSVFPSARRAQQGDEYKNSRLLGEKSIVDIYGNIASTDSYIISTSFSETIEFILGGYDFTIKDLSTFLENEFSDATEIWASIELDTAVPDFPELDGEDADDVYKGLNLTSSEPEDEDVIKLKLLTRESSSVSWNIFEGSTKRFYYSQIYFSDLDIIDGGIVEA